MAFASLRGTRVGVGIALLLLVGLVGLAAPLAHDAFPSRPADDVVAHDATPAPSGSLVIVDGTIRGDVELEPGTFALVTVWSEAEEKEHAAQLIGLSGSFALPLAHDVPDLAGGYEVRLWILSGTAAAFLQEHWPDPSEGCSAGFAGLDHVRSRIEGDPARLAGVLPVALGSRGVDAIEVDGSAC